MSGGWKCKENITDGADDGILVASREVGTSYGTLEEGVTCPKHILVFTIEAKAAWGVSRCVEDSESVGAKGDGGLVSDVMHRWLWWNAGGIEVEGVHVDTELLVLLLIGHAAFDVELVVTMHESATHDVVEMEVGAEHVDEFELMPFDVVLDGCPLCLRHASWVDDAGFFCVVTDDVTVDHQRIYLESLDV